MNNDVINKYIISESDGNKSGEKKRKNFSSIERQQKMMNVWTGFGGVLGNLEWEVAEYQKKNWSIFFVPF